MASPIEKTMGSCQWVPCAACATEQVGKRRYCAQHAEKVKRVRDAKFVPHLKP